MASTILGSSVFPASPAETVESKPMHEAMSDQTIVVTRTAGHADAAPIVK